MSKFTGTCRIRGENGSPNLVRVTDGDLTFEDVDEPSYNFAMIKPALEELPWCTTKKSSPSRAQSE